MRRLALRLHVLDHFLFGEVLDVAGPHSLYNVIQDMAARLARRRFEVVRPTAAEAIETDEPLDGPARGLARSVNGDPLSREAGAVGGHDSSVPYASGRRRRGSWRLLRKYQVFRPWRVICCST